MSRRQLFTVTFLLVFLLLLWELGLILRPFFSPILWAVILATTTYPLYIRVLARAGQRENIAAAIMTTGVLVTAVLPAVYGMILAASKVWRPMNKPQHGCREDISKISVRCWPRYPGWEG
jgi:predicted PurR-regulated permease PerM